MSCVRSCAVPRPAASEVSPKIAYQYKHFSTATLATIEQANAIIEDYQAQGYDLTLRQLYYQFVARGLLPNKDTEYKRLGSIINDARLAGLVDWEAILDRTRNLASLSHWESPSEILYAVAEQYRRDLWHGQQYHVEVWVEKEALAGVVQAACEPHDVSYFSCRGYTSQSEMWAAAQRLESYSRAGKQCVIVHLGDHDPSGIDMTRDIQDRLELFMGGVPVERIALNMDQIQQHSPPPNPAKTTDSRFTSYIVRFGRESWELDALDPAVLNALITDAIEVYIDQDRMDEKRTLIDSERRQLSAVAESWGEAQA
jgi:hypothetical protein